MSRASNGTYTLPGGNPVVTNTVISSTWANTTLSDLANEMTDSLDRSGKGGMLAALLGVDGTVALPGFAFVSEPSSGMYRVSAGNIAFATLGAIRAGVDGTGHWGFSPATAAGASYTFTMRAAGLVDATFTGSGNNILALQVTNPNTGNAAVTLLAIDNLNHGLSMGITGTGYAPAYLTNGPTGESVFITTDGGVALPFSLGVNNTERVRITSTQLQSVGAVAAGLVDMTPDTGTFTLTGTGFTAGVTGTATWRKIGKLVELFIPVLTGTSNATTFTGTGMPAAIQPAALAVQSSPCQNAADNSVAFFTAQANINSGSGTITFLKSGSSSGWTAAGTKSIGGFTMAYLLD